MYKLLNLVMVVQSVEAGVDLLTELAKKKYVCACRVQRRCLVAYFREFLSL